MENIDKQTYVENVKLALGGNNQLRLQGENYINQLQEKNNFVDFILEIILEMQNDVNQIGVFSAVILKNYLNNNYTKQEQLQQQNIQINVLNLYEKVDNDKINNILIDIVQKLIKNDFPKSQLLEIIVNQNLINISEQIKNDRKNKIIKMVYKIFKCLVKTYFDKTDPKTFNKNDQKVFVKNYLNHKFQEVKQISDEMIIQVQEQVNLIPSLLQTHDIRLILQQFGETINMECVEWCVKLQVLQQSVNQVEVSWVVSQMSLYHHLYQIGMNGLIQQVQLPHIQKQSVQLLLRIRKLIQCHLILIRQLVEEGDLSLIHLQEVLKLINIYYLQPGNYYLFNSQILLQAISTSLQSPVTPSECYHQMISIYQKINKEDSIKALQQVEGNNINEAMGIINSMIQSETYRAQGFLFWDRDNDLNTDSLQLEESIKKEYLGPILTFIIERGLVMSERQVLQIQHNGETAFSDSINSNLISIVRETAIALVKTIIYYSDEEAVSAVLEQQLAINKYPQQTLPFQQQVQALLNREALYFLVAKLYFYVKHSFDFSNHLSLFCEYNSVPFLAITCLYLTEVYLEEAYIISNEIKVSLMDTVTTIIHQPKTNICLRLQAVIVFMQLIDDRVEGSILLSVLQDIIAMLDELEQIDSKVTILQLLSKLIKKTSMMNMIGQYRACIFNYLQQQWTNTKNYQTICLKNQIIQVIIHLVEVNDNSSQAFVLMVIYESISQESELQLAESGMKLLLIYLQTLNANKNDNQTTDIQLFVYFCEQIMKELEKNEYYQQSMFQSLALILIELITIGHTQILDYTGQLLAQLIIKIQKDVKVICYCCLIDIYDQYLLQCQLNNVQCYQSHLANVINYLYVQRKEMPQDDQIFITSKLLQLMNRGLLLDYSLTIQLLQQYSFILLINDFTDNLSNLQQISHSIWDYKLLILFVFHYFKVIQSECINTPDDTSDLISQFNQMGLEQKQSIVTNMLMTVSNLMLFTNTHFPKQTQLGQQDEHYTLSIIEPLLLQHDYQPHLNIQSQFRSLLHKDPLYQRVNVKNMFETYYNTFKDQLQEQHIASIVRDMGTLDSHYDL